MAIRPPVPGIPAPPTEGPAPRRRFPSHILAPGPGEEGSPPPPIQAPRGRRRFPVVTQAQGPPGGGPGRPALPEEAYNTNADPRTKREEIGRFTTPGDRSGEIDLNPNTNYGLNRSFVFFHTRAVTADFINLHHATLISTQVDFNRRPVHTVPLIVNVTASGGIPVQGAATFLEFTNDVEARVVDQMGGTHVPNRRAFYTRNDGTIFLEYLPSYRATSPVEIEAAVKDKYDTDIVRSATLTIEI